MNKEIIKIILNRLKFIEEFVSKRPNVDASYCTWYNVSEIINDIKIIIIEHGGFFEYDEDIIKRRFKRANDLIEDFIYMINKNKDLNTEYKLVGSEIKSFTKVFKNE